ncbi:hypothetical protein B0H11DRAFT_1921103 [Mycena galericulata]|nr:hypothetical protein B0H11DRAFT_1921103 [Mycena galericulata]
MSYSYPSGIFPGYARLYANKLFFRAIAWHAESNCEKKQSLDQVGHNLPAGISQGHLDSECFWISSGVVHGAQQPPLKSPRGSRLQLGFDSRTPDFPVSFFFYSLVVPSDCYFLHRSFEQNSGYSGSQGTQPSSGVLGTCERYPLSTDSPSSPLVHGGVFFPYDLLTGLAGLIEIEGETRAALTLHRVASNPVVEVANTDQPIAGGSRDLEKRLRHLEEIIRVLALPHAISAEV